MENINAPHSEVARLVEGSLDSPSGHAEDNDLQHRVTQPPVESAEDRNADSIRIVPANSDGKPVRNQRDTVEHGENGAGAEAGVDLDDAVPPVELQRDADAGAGAEGALPTMEELFNAIGNKDATFFRGLFERIPPADLERVLAEVNDEGDTLLGAALGCLDADAFEVLVSKGASVDQPCTGDKRSPLTLLAAICSPENEADVFELAEKVLSCGASVDKLDGSGENALHAAAATGSVEMVSFLCKHGATIEQGDSRGVTALGRALEGGEESAAAAAELLKLGAVTTFKGKSGQVAAHCAASGGCIELWEKLKALGVPLDAADDRGRVAMHHAASAARVEMLEYLIAEGRDPCVRDTAGSDAYHCACSSGSISAVEFMAKVFTERGAEIQRRDGSGNFPVHVAAATDVEGELIAFMLQEDEAEAKRRNRDGMTPLQVASRAGNLSAVQALLKVKLCDVNASVRAADAITSDTAILLAARGGHTEVVRQLVTAGASPHVRNATGENLLYIAAETGNVELAALALELGVSPSVRAKDRTPLHAACERGDREICELIITHARGGIAAPVPDRVDGESDPAGAAGEGQEPRRLFDRVASCQTSGGAPPTAQALLAMSGRPNQATPLHVAAGADNAGLIKLLLEAGANPFAVDKRGLLAVFYGARSGSLAGTRLLIKATFAAYARVRGGSQAPKLFDLDDRRCPIHAAILADFAVPGKGLPILDALTGAGLDLNAVAADGRTLLTLAQDEGSTAEFIAGLRERGAKEAPASASDESPRAVAPAEPLTDEKPASPLRSSIRVRAGASRSRGVTWAGKATPNRSKSCGRKRAGPAAVVSAAAKKPGAAVPSPGAAGGGGGETVAQQSASRKRLRIVAPAIAALVLAGTFAASQW
jgi:ankyrin repeat protein